MEDSVSEFRQLNELGLSMNTNQTFSSTIRSRENRSTRLLGTGNRSQILGVDRGADQTLHLLILQRIAYAAGTEMVVFGAQ